MNASGGCDCRRASLAFYECKSLHIRGLRSSEVGREGDSEQKEGEDRMEEGGGGPGIISKSH